jgi:predicted AlkP superfamily pyrophosphatase or phosphodiesterase
MRIHQARSFLAIVLLFAAASFTTPSVHAQRRERGGARPRLIVVITVDQMRGDVTTRYAGYLHHGLRRLVDGGLVFAEAHHDHAITVTAAGHATLSTGCTPAHTGIIGNDWFDRATGKQAYCTGDDSVQVLDPTPGGTDSQSPRNLRRPALGDWLKAASPASRVFSIAGKDRSAVLMGGLKPNGAYWYQDKTGHFVTSTHYATALPRWLVAFNNGSHIQAALRTGWQRTLSPDDYLISSEDNAPAENDGVDTTLPHAFDGRSPESVRAFNKGIMQTPFGDEMTLDFSERLIVEEGLGTDRAPDMLWIGLSAADIIGHAYGPTSHETQDYYVRLDRRLGVFLEFLDRRIGRSHYVVALTSDHGVMLLPEELNRRGIPSSRVTTMNFAGSLSSATDVARAELGLTKPLFRASNYMGVYLDLTEASARGLSISDVRSRVAAEIRGLSFVADAMTAEELSATPAESDRPYLDLYRRSFSADRSPDVAIRPKEHALVSWKMFGTSHGTPYRFDTHIPMIFYGAGIPAGQRSERVRTIDLAPTLANLLDVNPPASIDGKALAIPKRQPNGQSAPRRSR